ncbi:OB-fold domain-containing protein [Bradyrhizobium sp. 174]|nr:OB-fold domain-containing protein [Bradyrhizobium sp. 174]
MYSFSPNRLGKEPYALACVALSEGLIMMSNVVDADPARLSIGGGVRWFSNGTPGRRSHFAAGVAAGPKRPT